jgi:predicted transglutaminase-like cysteine proteinase
MADGVRYTTRWVERSLPVIVPAYDKAIAVAGGLGLVSMMLLGGVQAARAAQPNHLGPFTIEHAVNLTSRRPLLAHVRFCIHYEEQCDAYRDRRDPTRSSRDHFIELLRVNRTVNRAISPRPDRGVDSWDINVTEGDCEDYALQKRAELIDRGWPSEALRIAVVRLRNGVYHAVLLVQVGDTDFVLDNLTSQILPWDRAPYRFLMLQDRANPRSWHNVAPRPRNPLVS